MRLLDVENVKTGDMCALKMKFQDTSKNEEENPITLLQLFALQILCSSTLLLHILYSHWQRMPVALMVLHELLR